MADTTRLFCLTEDAEAIARKLRHIYAPDHMRITNISAADKKLAMKIASDLSNLSTRIYEEVSK